MNKRRMAYKRYDWRRHSLIVLEKAFHEEIMEGKHTPIAGHGKSFTFRKVADIGGRKATLYCTLVGEKAISRMFEAMAKRLYDSITSK